MALLNILTSLNWFDFFIVIILVRIGYTALKTGLPIELFKFLGALLAAYLSLHYYVAFSDTLTSLKNISAGVINFIFFLGLAFFGYLVFVILRKIFFRLINIEAENKLNIWGGFFLGLVRGVLVVSLLSYVFTIFPMEYFHKSTKNSFSAKYLIKAAPAAYGVLWDGVMSKFMAKEEFNETVLSVQEDLIKIKK